MSISRVTTVAFSGIEAIKIDVQVHIGPGLPFFTIVGLPDKSIAEAKERIRAVFNIIGLSLPAKRITVNMSPASLQKEGSHYDLPIAVGMLVSMGIIAEDAVQDWVILGELALDGSLQKVPGVLMAAMFANSIDATLVCPFDSRQEARLASQDLEIIAPKKIVELISYVKGECAWSQDFECEAEDEAYDCDMQDVHGQAVAKRAFEIAAAGSFHILLIGPPGVGKSMLAKRLVTILPDLIPKEAVEVTMIYSIANKLFNGTLKRRRPFREPHYSASLPALVGGGARALPGEISLAHNGVLFLDELAEYSKALEGLRLSMEYGYVTIARAQSHITYPANAQIIAAMNPCKCGYYGTARACSRAPVCAQEYQNKISGPIMDRFDLTVYMDNVETFDASCTSDNSDDSSTIKKRVVAAREFHENLYRKPVSALKLEDLMLTLEAFDLLSKFCSKNQLSRRSFIKIGRIARIIANLAKSASVEKVHIAEAIMYRKH